MKKVIIGKKLECVYIEDLKCHDIIGVKSSLGNKFFLSKRESSFQWVGEMNIASSSKGQYSSLESALAPYHDVFLFDSHSELFEWLQAIY
jgi:hypothetical protein